MKFDVNEKGERGRWVWGMNDPGPDWISEAECRQRDRFAYVIAALFLLWFVCFCFGCVQSRPVVVPPASRTLEVHTCVPAAHVWLDGAMVPNLTATTDADGTVNFAAFPATITAFNLHASAPPLPEYGYVVTGVVPSADRLVVILGSCAK